MVDAYSEPNVAMVHFKSGLHIDIPCATAEARTSDYGQLLGINWHFVHARNAAAKDKRIPFYNVNEVTCIEVVTAVEHSQMRAREQRRYVWVTQSSNDDA